MYAYKESPFPWQDSLLQPQFVSQLCIVVAVLSNPEFVGGCRSTRWCICLLFRHWLFKYVRKEWSVSMVKLVIAATVCESAVNSSCSAFTWSGDGKRKMCTCFNDSFVGGCRWTLS